MDNRVGFRFRPTDEEIVDHYLGLKNLGNSSGHVDEAISTVDICNFDPWNLPSQSRTEQRDYVWYFFGRKENKYSRGDRQSRKTKSGFWKKTGPTMNIFRKRGNHEKIGEKKVLVFHMSKILGGSKTDWVIHEYHSTSLSPNQMMSYTVCKVKFKGEEGYISSSCGSEIRHSHSLIPHMNNSRGLGTGSERLSIELPYSQELENPPLLCGFLDEQQESQFEDANQWDFGNISSDDWKYLLDDVVEQSNSVSMQPATMGCDS